MMVWSVLLQSALAAPVPPTVVDHGLLLEAPETGLFQEGVNSPSVAFDDDTSTWHLYFEAAVPEDEVLEGCDQGTRLGHATSTDGVTWSMSPDAVIEPVTGTDWGCGAAHPSVLYDGAFFHLFFSASDVPDTEGGANAQLGIGYGISRDGHNFMVEGLIADNPADASGSRTGIGFPTAVLVDDTLVLLYVRSPDVYRMWSTDTGATWTADPDPVLAPDGSLGWASSKLNGPSMICHDDGPKGLSALIGGKDSAGLLTLGTARSLPGSDTWTLVPDPLFAVDPGWTHWKLLRTDTGRLVYYSTDADDGRKAIGLAATDLGFTTPQGKRCQRP